MKRRQRLAACLFLVVLLGAGSLSLAAGTDAKTVLCGPGYRESGSVQTYEKINCNIGYGGLPQAERVRDHYRKIEVGGILNAVWVGFYKAAGTFTTIKVACWDSNDAVPTKQWEEECTFTNINEMSKIDLAGQNKQHVVEANQQLSFEFGTGLRSQTDAGCAWYLNTDSGGFYRDAGDGNWVLDSSEPNYPARHLQYSLEIATPARILSSTTGGLTPGAPTTSRRSRAASSTTSSTRFAWSRAGR